MPHNRYFHDAPFHEHEKIVLSDAESHHLRVSRPRIGDAMELVNGRNQLALARLVDQGRLEIEQISERPPPRQIILAMALPKMNHLEWVIEKGTELNATAFWLFTGMLSEKEGLSPNQLDRLRALSIAAMKQCGRLDLPSIEVKPPLLKWEKPAGTLIFGELDAPYLWKLSPVLNDPIIIFIGPEKGFDPKERAFLQQSLGAQAVKFHPNTLRAETAPLAALSIISSYMQID